MLYYLIPTAYLFKSRLKTKLEKISWAIIYVIPTFIISYSNSSISLGDFLILFILGTLTFFSLYEVGYIENDVKTIKKELNPTIRVKKHELVYLNNNYKLIQILKILITFFLFVSLNIISDVLQVELYLFQFLLCLIFMRISFYLHNSIRNRLNILTFFCLSISKYFSSILLFIPFNESIALLVISFFMFPLLRTLEHATKPKYQMKKLACLFKSNDLSRVIYYAIALVLSTVLFLIYKTQPLLLSSMVMAYFFLYRLIVFIILLKKPNKFHEIRLKRNVKW